MKGKATQVVELRRFVGGINTTDHPEELDLTECQDGTLNVVFDDIGKVVKRYGTSNLDSMDLISETGEHKTAGMVDAPITGLFRASGLLNAASPITGHTLIACDYDDEGDPAITEVSGIFVAKAGADVSDFRYHSDPEYGGGDPTSFNSGSAWNFCQFMNMVIALNGQSTVYPQVWDGSDWFDLGISGATLKSDLGSTAITATVTEDGRLAAGIYKFVFVHRENATGVKAGYRSGPVPGVLSAYPLAVEDGESVKIENLPVPDNASYTYELYATQADGARFFRVAEIDTGASTTLVWKGDASDVGEGLGPELEGIFDDMPPMGCEYGTVFEGRLFLADKRTVYWSNPGNPHNFDPFDYEMFPGGSTITGLLGTRERLFVFTDNGIWRVLSDSSGIYWFRQIVSGVGCIAPRSIAEVGNYIVFMDHDGVRALSISGSDIWDGVQIPESLVSVPIGNEVASWTDLSKVAAASSGYDYFLSVRESGKSANNAIWVANFSRPMEINGTPRIARWSKWISDPATNEYGMGFLVLCRFSLAADGGAVCGGSSTAGRVLKINDSTRTNADIIHNVPNTPVEVTKTSPITSTIVLKSMVLGNRFFDTRIYKVYHQLRALSDVRQLLSLDDHVVWANTMELTGQLDSAPLPWSFYDSTDPDASLSVTFYDRVELDINATSLSDKCVGRIARMAITDEANDSCLEYYGFGLMLEDTQRERGYGG